MSSYRMLHPPCPLPPNAAAPTRVPTPAAATRMYLITFARHGTPIGKNIGWALRVFRDRPDT